MTKALLAVALVMLALGACLVHRPSEDLACSTTSQCTGGKQCTGGYCVMPNCPSDCSTCDEAAKTCTMNCTSSDSCGSVNCPTGWSCTINCVGDGACDNVTCAAGSTCLIDCNGGSSCKDVTCKDACSCDLTCASGACAAISCPTASGGVKCTTGGTAGSPCDSAPSGCTKC